MLRNRGDENQQNCDDIDCQLKLQELSDVVCTSAESPIRTKPPVAGIVR